MEGDIEEETLSGTLRIKANGNWSQMSMVNTRSKLTSHTKILDMIINASLQRWATVRTSKYPLLLDSERKSLCDFRVQGWKEP